MANMATAIGDKSLDGVVSHPEGRESFISFLEMEFSIENFMFKERVEEYKEILENSTNTNNGPAAQHDGDHGEDFSKHAAEAICFEFVHVDGARSVNICHQAREDILSGFKKWHELDRAQRLGLFDQGYNEVLNLLARDSFIRFVRSSQYQKLLMESNKAEALQQVEMF
eukprot:TRINITY_DN14131_c0_g1_i2.p2 TRINITY_DN14131_c0_g1~~TRINITY_DN14131_c0_g1_i2.p2  ORF type:complete len:169 (+),score=52.90 TRINITY_DN14131_c0_g1_i2:956-1462(+)